MMPSLTSSTLLLRHIFYLCSMLALLLYSLTRSPMLSRMMPILSMSSARQGSSTQLRSSQLIGLGLQAELLSMADIDDQQVLAFGGSALEVSEMPVCLSSGFVGQYLETIYLLTLSKVGSQSSSPLPSPSSQTISLQATRLFSKSSSLSLSLSLIFLWPAMSPLSTQIRFQFSCILLFLPLFSLTSSLSRRRAASLCRMRALSCLCYSCRQLWQWRVCSYFSWAWRYCRLLLYLLCRIANQRVSGLSAFLIGLGDGGC